MYAVVANCLLNVAGIPFGAVDVSSAMGGWVVVAAFLVSALILSTCVDRSTRLAWPEHELRWMTRFRIEEGFWDFRARCADAAVRNN